MPKGCQLGLAHALEGIVTALRSATWDKPRSLEFPQDILDLGLEACMVGGQKKNQEPPPLGLAAATWAWQGGPVTALAEALRTSVGTE